MLPIKESSQAYGQGKKRTRTQILINKIRSKREEITTNTKDIEMIIKDYYKQLNTNRLENLEEMDKFLEMYYFPRLYQKEIESVKKTSCEIEPVIEKTLNKQKYRTRWLHMRILSNSHRRVNAYPSQNFSKI